MKKTGKAGVLCLAIIMIFSTLGFENRTNASDNAQELIKTHITYTDDETKACIEFDLNSVNREKYDIAGIISKKDGSVIYDKASASGKIASQPVTYAAEENGNYDFAVKYTEKPDSAENEAGNTIKACEDGANAAPSDNGVGTDESGKQKELKEKTITVTVDKIKDRQTPPVNGLTKPEETDGISNDAFRTAGNTGSVDLSGEFNIQSYVTQTNGTKQDVTQTMISLINGNKAVLTSRDLYASWPYQQTVLTWKQTLDFTRSFELRGSLEVGTLADGAHRMTSADGMAIAFHHDGINYKFKGNYSSNFGIYNSDGHNTGINSKAIVAEVDAWDNAGRPDLGDPHGKGSEGGHLAIMGMENGGGAAALAMNYKSEPNGSWMSGMLPFQLKWDMNPSGTGTMTLTFNGEPVSYSFNPTTYFAGADASHVNMSLGGATGNSGSKVDNSYLICDNFAYTDINPVMETTITPKGNSNPYAIPNETLTVRHKITNTVDTAKALSDVLNLDNLAVRGGAALVPANIKVGTDPDHLQDYPGGDFSKNAPMDISLPAHKKPYYVEYEVKIPDIRNYGKTDTLDYKYILGKKGMTQIPYTGSMPIKNKPSLVIKTGGTAKPVYDVGSMNGGTADQLNGMLWENLYAKTAAGAETKLVKDTAAPGGSDINVTWGYSVNLKPVSRAPDSVLKGTVYSLNIQVTDKLDSRLSNSFKKYVPAADNVSAGFLNGSTYNCILANNLPDITETKLVTLQADPFKAYVMQDSKAKGLQINNTSGEAVLTDSLTVNVNGWVNAKGYAERRPGNYSINLSLNGLGNVSVNAEQAVTKNTWSYDTKDRTEANGASGFIVIPKRVALKDHTSGSQVTISGETEVFFAGYTGSADTKYTLSADQSFQLINQEDSSVITVTTGSDGSIAKPDNKLEIGEINSQHGKGQGYKITFTAPKSEHVKSVKGRWDGNVTFYFEEK